jgi:hypothetical protein
MQTQIYRAIARRIFCKRPVKTWKHEEIKDYGITFVLWTVTDFSHE